jgi:hypothetical protein
VAVGHFVFLPGVTHPTKNIFTKHDFSLYFGLEPVYSSPHGYELHRADLLDAHYFDRSGLHHPVGLPPLPFGAVTRTVLQDARSGQDHLHRGSGVAMNIHTVKSDLKRYGKANVLPDYRITGSIRGGYSLWLVKGLSHTLVQTFSTLEEIDRFLKGKV